MRLRPQKNKWPGIIANIIVELLTLKGLRNIPMPKIKANGINIYYEIQGQGKPLVLIMGLRRNAEWWYCQIPALAEHFQVLVFDNRGAGRSDQPAADYSIPLFADDTAALMKGLGLSSAHVLGISMGGYIAQELAINYPELVQGLILGCTGAGGSRAVLMTPERLAKFTANKGLSPEEILRKDMDIYFSEGFIQEWPEKIEEFVEISRRHYQPPESFLRQFAACQKHDTLKRLHRIIHPTLIMTGDDDPLIPPENSRILKEMIPQARLEFFPAGRHCFFMEFASKFNQKVIDFLEKKIGRR
ncbi:MAG TPA: alpha/beta hydrolase [candidate division Zixibacteria bacterium]|nr:alpha/beta hydrolase [candidate division Zixibacteria bacterium]